MSAWPFVSVKYVKLRFRVFNAVGNEGGTTADGTTLSLRDRLADHLGLVHADIVARAIGGCAQLKVGRRRGSEQPTEVTFELRVPALPATSSPRSVGSSPAASSVSAGSPRPTVAEPLDVRGDGLAPSPRSAGLVDFATHTARHRSAAGRTTATVRASTAASTVRAAASVIAAATGNDARPSATEAAAISAIPALTDVPRDRPAAAAESDASSSDSRPTPEPSPHVLPRAGIAVDPHSGELAPAPAPRAVAEPRPARDEALRVAVLEDNALILRGYEHFFGGNGVYLGRERGEAVGFVATVMDARPPFDAVVLDENLDYGGPGFDESGSAVAGRLRAAGFTGFVIICTGGSDLTECASRAEGHVDRVITKAGFRLVFEEVLRGVRERRARSAADALTRRGSSGGASARGPASPAPGKRKLAGSRPAQIPKRRAIS